MMTRAMGAKASQGQKGGDEGGRAWSSGPEKRAQPREDPRGGQEWEGLVLAQNSQRDARWKARPGQRSMARGSSFNCHWRDATEV